MLTSIGQVELAEGNSGARLLLWSTEWYANSVVVWHSTNVLPYSEAASFGASNSGRFAVGQGAMSQEGLALATAGDISLLLWRERDTARGRLALYATRLDFYGHILDAQPLRLADLTCDATVPAVATNGIDFLVAWQEPGAIRATRIARDGHRLEAGSIPIFTNVVAPECSGTAPDLAWNGSSYLVAWAGVMPSDAHLMAVQAMRIGPDGSMRDGTPILIATRAFNSDSPIRDVHVASNGTDFLVTYNSNTDGVWVF